MKFPSMLGKWLGSFGYEKEHSEVFAKAVGQTRLFDVIEQISDSDEVVAVGTSCRHQIAGFLPNVELEHLD